MNGNGNVNEMLYIGFDFVRGDDELMLVKRSSSYTNGWGEDRLHKSYSEVEEQRVFEAY